MTQKDIANGLNEWMHRYTEDPRAFEAEFETVGVFLRQCGNGEEPSYGQKGATYLKQLVKELKKAS